MGVGVKVLAVEQSYRGGLCEDRPGLPHARHSQFKTPAKQDTAEPLSQDGGASGKTYLRKGETLCSSCERSEGGKLCKTALQTPRSVKKEGGEVFQVLEQSFPCSLWMRPHWSRYFPVACGEVFPTAGRYSLKEAAACGKAKLEEAPDRNCGPRRAHAGAGLS